MKIVFERSKKDINTTNGIDSLNPQSNNLKPKKKLSVEKVIVIILSVLLLGLAIFVFWDLYGDKISFNCSANSSTANIATSDTSSPSNDTAFADVDSSLYASCSSQISDSQIYKDCCDNLSADDTVKKACKKVSDDATGTTPPTASITPNN